MPKADDVPPLPPGLDLLWGRRVPGRRGPKAELSVDAIVTAAMRVADADGLDAVSMARVASELGFSTMSLYRHVTNKDELLQLMWNASAQGAESLVLEGTGWRERLRAWSMIQRDLIDEHPWITEMPMAAPPVAPNSLTFVERGLETLADTGLRDKDKMRVLGLISSYTLSEARMANDAARAAKAAVAAGTKIPAGAGVFEGLLRQLVNEADYPILHRLAWDSADEDTLDERGEFEFGIDRILDGIQALIDQTAVPAPSRKRTRRR